MDYNSYPHTPQQHQHQQQQQQQQHQYQQPPPPPPPPPVRDSSQSGHRRPIGSEFADVPIVPVAAAPKDENLYESLMRYHNENDSISTDDSGARRRRNPKVAPDITAKSGATAGLKADDDGSSIEDRKLPAKPVTLQSSFHSTGHSGHSRPTAAATTATSTAATTSFSGSGTGTGTGSSVEHSLEAPHITTTSTSTTPKVQPSSMPTPGQRKMYPLPDYTTNVDKQKPGIVHVSEPAIRPDSAMYQAAYGAPPPPSSSQHRFPEPMSVQVVRDTIAALKQSREAQQVRESPRGGLNHSTHSTRSTDFGRPPDPVLRHHSGPPEQLLRQQSGVHPPEHMMNIGNDDHIGLLPQKTRSRNKSPIRIFGKRSSAEKEAQEVAAIAAAAATTSPSNWYAKHFPAPGPMTQPQQYQQHQHYQPHQQHQQQMPHQHMHHYQQQHQQQHHLQPAPVERSSSLTNSMDRVAALGNPNTSMARSYTEPITPVKYAERSRSAHATPLQYGHPMNTMNTMNTGIPNYGYPTRLAPSQHEPSHEDTQSLSTAESSMDDDLRLALELSKQDVGIGPPPTIRPTHMPKQTSFGREAMAQARQASNSSLADLLLALKLSAEESGLDGRGSTNLDELLAFEVAQDSPQHMTDFVAAGISTAQTLSPQPQTPPPQPPPTASASASVSATTTTHHGMHSQSQSQNKNQNAEEQYRILEKIRQEQEQRQLELALKASQQESVQPGAFRMKHPVSHYSASQQKAMEEWARPSPMETRPTAKRENSVSSIDSEGRRQQLLERGTSETKEAIQSGQAHIVICRGCNGRLQAPITYSLVFCPKCHTISPA